MSNEELVSLIQAGERDKVLELWMQVERFVSMQAGKRAAQLDGFGGVTEEDLYQSGFLALVKAVDSFDPTKGRSFISWLGLALKTAFAEAAGYRNQRRDMLDFAVEFDEPIPETEDLTIADCVADPAAANAFEEMELRLWQEQLRPVMETALQSITEEWSDILRRRFYQNQTLSEIAKEEKCGVEKIRLRECKALRAMRSPRITRELRQFVELNTNYYSKSGLSPFLIGGSQVERLVIKREENANWWLSRSDSPAP